MATVVIGMHSNHGHLMPTYKLASRLQRRGYRIIYLMSSKSKKAYIEQNGFEFKFLDLYGPYWKLPDKVGSFLSDIKYIKKRERKVYNEMMPGGMLEDLLLSLNPDLVIWDTSDPIMAMAIKCQGYNVVLFSSALDHGKEDGLPPLDSWLLPGGSPWNRFKIKWSWIKHEAYFNVINFLYNLIGIGQRQKLRHLCRQYGLNPNDWLNIKRGFLPGLYLPEVVACPRSFDFVRKDKKRVKYIGPCIYEDSKWGEIDWTRFNPERPLIYCSFGSMTFVFKQYATFLKKLISCFAKRPEYDFLVAGGEFLQEENLPPCPANVYIGKVVPQLEVLQRAAMFITHAGLNSVKESIYNGVPMIAFPFASDGFGNSSRIVHHRIGLRGDYKHVDEEGICTLIDRVMNDAEFKQNIQKMRRIFQEAEDEQAGVAWVETQLKSKNKRNELATI